MGGKRVDFDSEFQPRKRCKRYHGNDLISMLPDDLLVVILSSLSLKEAARTSVLSSRWINLWRHTLSLDFDAEPALCNIAQHFRENMVRNVERRKYINWVNSVLRSHKGLTLKEFKIRFDLDKLSQKAITMWLQFAFARQVERLELDLSVPEGGDGYSSNRYNLINYTLFGFKPLKALILKHVNVSSEAVDFFLRNCPLLEQLVVHCSVKLSYLEVCGSSSLRLKHLEIVYCTQLKSIKVSAPNLTSLRIFPVRALCLESVPMLVNLYASSPHVKDLVPVLSCCFSQLEILTLKIFFRDDILEQCKIAQLPKLKRLEIVWLAKEGDESLLELTYFVRKSPCLREFVVKLWGWGMEERQCRSKREVKKGVEFQHPHLHLKVVELVGYYGRNSDVEFVRYMVENCVTLEQLIIDPHFHTNRSPYISCTPRQLEQARIAKKLAIKQLPPLLPNHIQLLIR